MIDQTTTGAETRKDIEATDKPKSSKYWLAELDAACRREENWHKRGRAVVKKYRDEREREAFLDDCREQSFNMLWSNTEVLKSALFASMGKPDVRRRFPPPGKGQKIAKQVALVMENAAKVVNNRADLEYEVGRAVEDFLLPGRGQIWAELADDNGHANISAVHVGWEDYRQGPGSRWGDVPWVARRKAWTRDDLKDPANGIPKDYAMKIPLNYGTDGYSEADMKDQPELFKRASLWEVWDKNRKQRLLVAEDFEFILRADDDPFKLEGFFPCPRPLIANSTTDSAIPIPEYILYQDQAEELNRISTRIFRLIKMLKVCGLYDATLDDKEQLANLQNASDGQFLPAKGVQGLAQSPKGLGAAYLFWPMAETIAALQQLYLQRDQLINSIYQLTGISDIIRGSTDPRETKGAQALKAQFGSMRMQMRQKEVQRFIRDTDRIIIELVAEHCGREQLQEMTGIPLPTEADKQRAQQMLQFAAMQAQMQQQAQAPQGGPQGGGQTSQPQLPAPAPQGAPA